MSAAAISPLQYFIHHDSDALRIEMAGKLNGEAARSAYQSSRMAMLFAHKRPLVVDISFVVEADEIGQAVLRAWRQLQARIVARSPESRAIAEPIVNAPLTERTPRPGLLRRIASLLFSPLSSPLSGHGAGIPAIAEGANESRALTAEESVAITQVSNAQPLARKLR
jgi:hypothetical protein